MTNDTLIVSMTSWPRRIKYVAKALYSILKQKVDKNLYHLVLVLAEPEFPNKENDLPNDLRLLLENGLVEIIWYHKNIFSHKKLMPTLAKYPNNPILVTDEDMIRPSGWLNTFIEDNKKYPNDIIVGGCVFDIGFKHDKFQPNLRFKFDNRDCAGKIIKNRRPASGFGGTLFPANCFKDKRFFDEDLMMKCSRYCDESWQFCFNIIEDKTIRWLSKYYEYWKYDIPGSQAISMTKLRTPKDSVESIYEKLFKEFPEFKEKLFRRIK